MPSIQEFIAQQGFIVLDGGLATELENQGHSLNDPLWSAKILLSSPAPIAEVHHSYYLAGADVAITSSYQATFPGLAAKGLTHQQSESVIRRSVSVALEARTRFWNDPYNQAGRLHPLVAASIGPYGAYLHDGSEYRGDYKIGLSELKAFHRERLSVLSDSGADLLACETIPSLTEAAALVELLNEEPTLPAWISFTCPDDSHISDGTPFADAVSLVSRCPSVVAIGVNCSAPAVINNLLEKARAVTNKLLIAYPNRGELYNASTCTWESTNETPVIEAAAAGWYQRGARLVGGCCRTTPATIRGIRAALTSAHTGNN